ncbi:hypothetical protein NBRC3299_1534 [Acetobacter pasteurianus NBRC 3299]|nr:hypothetical protein NBRC3299_1534 [Acetobacter pasteurianus NBRC 3299]
MVDILNTLPEPDVKLRDFMNDTSFKLNLRFIAV